MGEFPGVEFIHFCRDIEPEERLEKLPETLGVREVDITDNARNALNYIMDFLSWWDQEYHFTQEEILRDYDYEYASFFGYVLHSFISEDIRSILTLALTGHLQQANVLLRRVVEYTLYSVCLDLLSRFGTARFNVFEIYWLPREWKKLLRGQRVSEDDISAKLKKIYELNKKDEESLQEFRERFFREGNEADFLMLMYKSICKVCAEKKKHLKIEPIKFEEFPSEGDVIEPVFNYWKDYIKCEFCEEHKAFGLVFHVLEMKTVFKILKVLLEDRVVNAVSNLEKTYSVLSNYFVHFATDVDSEHIAQLLKKDVDFLNYEGLIYTLRNLSMVLCSYFILLKNRFDIDDRIQYCEVRKNEFNSFFEF
ncbi:MULTISPECIES: hypothetical protein [unclassified Archaeoglobus]|mgnify:CR=1 FL=1|jgi:hypothetical protein|uniref:hypothetical protein n=1 Tax=unclassified Archaeoglobus TaxID=2643606 RepID=UPI0025BAC45E|nr:MULTISPECIES: hypothetical protein [unclassified Archaeoglobus]